LPDLLSAGLIGIDDEVFAGRLGDLMIDLQASRPVGNAVTVKGGESTFLCDGLERDRGFADRDFQLCLVPVPTELLSEESLKIKRFQALANCGDVERHELRFRNYKFKNALIFAGLKLILLSATRMSRRQSTRDLFPGRFFCWPILR